jgi:hypothetical protein
MRDVFKGALLLVSAAVLSACTQTTEVTRSAQRSRQEPVRAFALPPPGGPAVVDVSERRYANAIEQDIALATRAAVSGQNFLRVQFFGPMGRDAGDTRLPNPPIAEAAIGNEMRTALPGVAMVRSALYAQNSYGPFGYAFGRRGSDVCMYAWQRLANTTAHPGYNAGSIQVRLRLCETGATEQALLSTMYGMTINASMAAEGWNPYGEPAAADPRLGQTGQPIFPAGPSGIETVLAAPPAPAAPRRPRQPPAAAPAEPEVPAPPPGAPLVPPPPGGGDAGVPVVPPPPG